MDYHLLTKKCDGMCDSCECPPTEPHPSCKTPEGCRENGCLGWCDEHRPDPTLKPDIAALKKRLAEDTAFAALVTGDRPPTPVGWSDTDWLKHLEKLDEPLRRGVNGVCIRSTCECEREGLGDQCIWLKPVADHWSDCATNNAPAYPAGPCDCIPTPAMCRAAVVYLNGPEVYENLPREVLDIEESIYREVWLAMQAAAPNLPPNCKTPNARLSRDQQP